MKQVEPTESEQPVFSVIVTSYNNKKYLPQALESVLSQNSGYSYEIVVGDDGSTDGARDLLLEYQAKYPDIIRLIFNEKNMGAMPNYFNILSHCRGKYLALCADDDFWLPGKARKQADYLEANPDTGLVYSKVVLKHEDTTYKGTYKNDDLFGRRVETFWELLENNVMSSVSVMWRRDLTMKYIVQIDPLNRGWLTEDYPMWLWVTLNSKIKMFDEPLATYRIWTGSVSHPESYRKKMAFLSSIAESRVYLIRKYFDEVPLKYAEIDLFYRFTLAMIDRNSKRAKALKPEVCELRKRSDSHRVRKMMFGVRFPRLFVLLHGYHRRSI